MKTRKKGISLVETMVAIALLVGMGAGIAQFFLTVSNQFSAGIDRWQAQLAAESVTDLVASLSNDDLFTLLSAASTTTCVSASPPDPPPANCWTFTSATLPWLTSWETTPIASGGITIQVTLLNPQSLPSPYEADEPLVPAAGQLWEYDRQITTSVTFTRRGKTQSESMSPPWTRLLPAMSRPAVTQIFWGGGPNKGCALRDDGVVKCWDPALPDPLPKRQYGFGDTVQKISVGVNHGCALYYDKRVKCWGKNNKGQLGVNLATLESKDPVEVIFPNPGLHGEVQAISSGDGYSCALRKLGAAAETLWCWGSGLSGATFNPTPLPAAMGTLLFSAGTTAAGSSGLLTWNSLAVQKFTSKAGLPVTIFAVPAPPPTTPASSVLSTSNSGGHACAIYYQAGIGNTAWCWGNNASGQLGNGSTLASPTLAVQVVLPSSLPLQNQFLTSVVTGSSHSCALIVVPPAPATPTTFSYFSVYCWGKNSQGQLGVAGPNSSYALELSFPPASGETRPTLFAGQNSTCLLLPNKVVRCWGEMMAGSVIEKAQCL